MSSCRVLTPVKKFNHTIISSQCCIEVHGDMARSVGHEGDGDYLLYQLIGDSQRSRGHPPHCWGDLWHTQISYIYEIRGISFLQISRRIPLGNPDTCTGHGIEDIDQWIAEPANPDQFRGRILRDLRKGLLRYPFDEFTRRLA